MAADNDAAGIPGSFEAHYSAEATAQPVAEHYIEVAVNTPANW